MVIPKKQNNTRMEKRMVKRLVQSSKILDIPEKEWKRGQQ